MKGTSFVDKYLLSPSKKASNDDDFFNVFVKKGLDFFSGKLRGHKIVNYQTPRELKKILSDLIPQKPITKQKLNKTLDLIGKFSISQADKKYLAFPDTGNSKHAIGGAIYSQFLNQNQIAFDKSSPLGTIIEIQLIEWLRELIGYEVLPLEKIDKLSQVGGMWTSGGNLSNYISLLTALNNKFDSVKEKGLASLKKKPVLIMAGGIEHYSYKSACSWLGLGADSIIWSKPGENYTSSAENFGKTIKKIAKDKVLFYAVAIAGNCRTSGIDNISAIADVCKKYNLWFHVDACHGGSLLFSKKYKKLLKGIEKADSVSLDPHKSLFIPYSSSYILFKKPEVMNVYSRYPEKVNVENYLDLGLTTPFFGSRGFESLKFWLAIKGMGINTISKLVERRHKLAKYWYDLLLKNENVIVLNDLEFYRITFVVFPKKKLKVISQINDKEKVVSVISKYTKTISDKIYKNGKVCVDEFKVKDFNRKITNDDNLTYVVMGTTIGNPSTDEKNLTQADKILTQTINKFIKQYNKELDLLIKKGVGVNFKIESTSPVSWN